MAHRLLKILITPEFFGHIEIPDHVQSEPLCAYPCAKRLPLSALPRLFVKKMFAQRKA